MRLKYFYSRYRIIFIKITFSDLEEKILEIFTRFENFSSLSEFEYLISILSSYWNISSYENNHKFLNFASKISPPMARVIFKYFTSTTVSNIFVYENDNK